MNHREQRLTCVLTVCTCRPYLLYGIEEAIRGAQNGGVGVVVYFRKEVRYLSSNVSQVKLELRD